MLPFKAGGPFTSLFRVLNGGDFSEVKQIEGEMFECCVKSPVKTAQIKPLSIGRRSWNQHKISEIAFASSTSLAPASIFCSTSLKLIKVPAFSTKERVGKIQSKSNVSYCAAVPS